MPEADCISGAPSRKLYIVNYELRLLPSALTAGFAARSQIHNMLVLSTYAKLIPAGLQIYFAWLCYFYVAMALRECVLLVNGSHIRSWWISHHMWSALGSLLMLALPISSPSK